MEWLKPDVEQVRQAIVSVSPGLAPSEIAYLGAGWEYWAYTADDHVFRFPMRDRGSVWKLGDRSSTESLGIERSLGPLLRAALPCDVAVIDVYGESGPNDAPFAGHRFLPGEIVMSSKTKPSPVFGRDVGRLLKALQAVPAQDAIEAGVPLYDGPALRRDRASHYEDVIRRAFSLVSCEARTHIERVYEAYLNDAASFEFEPVLDHTDLAVNTLVDEAGNLSGLIDLGEAAVSSPALDLWLPTFGFKQLGIEEQSAECLAEAGIDEDALRSLTPELMFLDLRYPLISILHGLNVRDEAFVEDGIQELNALVPFGTVCS